MISMFLRRFAASSSPAVVCMVCVLLTLWRRTTPLSGPTGLDGYYYILQVDHVICHGRPYFISLTPLVFYLQATAAFLMGSAEMGIKASVWIATVCMFLVCMYFMRCYKPASCIPWVIAALVVCSSPFGLYETEFIKNLWGTLFLLGSCSLIVGRLTRRARIASYCLLAAAATSHKSTAILAGALLVCVVSWRSSLECQRGIPETALVKGIAIARIVLGVYFAGFVLLFVWNLQSFRFVDTLGGGLTLPMMNCGMLCMSVALVFSSALGPSTEVIADRIHWVMLWSSTFCAILCSLSFIELGLQTDDRIDRMCLTLFAVSGAQSCYILLHAMRRFHMKVVIATCYSVVFALMGFSTKQYVGAQVSKEYRLFTNDAMEVRQAIPSGTIVIAPHGVDFLIMAKYGIPSTHLLPRMRYEDLYWFVWKDEVESGECGGGEDECIELGAGQLVSDEAFHNY